MRCILVLYLVNMCLKAQAPHNCKFLQQFHADIMCCRNLDGMHDVCEGLDVRLTLLLMDAHLRNDFVHVDFKQLRFREIYEGNYTSTQGGGNLPPTSCIHVVGP